MAVKDYLESEVAVAVAVTAAVFSPRVRGVLRRGLVYGVAGVLKTGDALAAATRNAALLAQQSAATAGPGASAPSTMGAEIGVAVGMAGKTISSVTRSAVDAAQHAAVAVVQTVQEVTEQAKAGMERVQDTDASRGESL